MQSVGYCYTCTSTVYFFTKDIFWGKVLYTCMYELLMYLCCMNISLLILLLVSHYVCDFTHFSTQAMLSAKRTGKPLHPIFQHAVIHMVGVSAALGWFHFSVDVVMVCLAIELVSHFVIDVLKGRCNVWFPKVTDTSSYPHWYIFGFDQLLHQLVMVLIWYITLSI